MKPMVDNLGDLCAGGLYAKRTNCNEYIIHDDKSVLVFFGENTNKIVLWDQYVKHRFLE